MNSSQNRIHFVVAERVGSGCSPGEEYTKSRKNIYLRLISESDWDSAVADPSDMRNKYNALRGLHTRSSFQDRSSNVIMNEKAKTYSRTCAQKNCELWFYISSDMFTSRYVIFFTALSLISCHESIPLQDPLWTHFRDPLYSISLDQRSANWSTAIPPNPGHVGFETLQMVRLPMFRVILGVDLASPEDLSLLDILLYRPIPMELYIEPVRVNGSSSNNILSRCFDTIFQGAQDSERARDFLKALDQFTWLSKPEEQWTRVRDREAILACEVFTKDLEGVRKWLNSSLVEEPGDVFSSKPLDLRPRTAIVNGRRIDNATITTLLPLLISSQSDIYNDFKGSDEL